MNYRICLQGHLDPSWQPWVAGLQIAYEPEGVTVLSGPLPDQAALHGVLLTIIRLGLTLLSLDTRESAPPEQPPDLTRRN